MIRAYTKELISFVKQFARVNEAEKLVSIYETATLPGYKIEALQELRKVGYTINLTLFPLGADDDRGEEPNLFTDQKHAKPCQ